MRHFSRFFTSEFGKLNLSHFRLSAFPGFGHCQLILDYIDAHDLHETAQNKTASRILKDPPLNLNKPDSIQCCDFKKTSGQQLYRSIVLFEEKFTNVHTIHTSCHTIKLRFILEHWRKKENETNKNIHQTFIWILAQKFKYLFMSFEFSCQK